jgi:serine/threonine protein kinase
VTEVRTLFQQTRDPPPFVVLFHGISYHAATGHMYLIMEYCPSSLPGYVEGGEYEVEQDFCRLASQIAAGVAAMHKSGMAQRDLKPQNILLDERGRPKLWYVSKAGRPWRLFEASLLGWLHELTVSCPLQRLRSGQAFQPARPPYSEDHGVSRHHSAVPAALTTSPGSGTSTRSRSCWSTCGGDKSPSGPGLASSV